MVGSGAMGVDRAVLGQERLGIAVSGVTPIVVRADVQQCGSGVVPASCRCPFVDRVVGGRFAL